MAKSTKVNLSRAAADMRKAASKLREATKAVAAAELALHLATDAQHKAQAEAKSAREKFVLAGYNTTAENFPSFY